MRKLRKPLMACVALIGLMATSLAIAGPAQAYNNGYVDWKHGGISTGNCSVSQYSDYSGYDNGDYCNLGGTNFTKDSGGIAYKIEAYTDGVRRAKIEFHPYGEHLKVCDTSNDGDAVHVALQYLIGSTWYTKPLVSAPGTDATYECTDQNYAFEEGRAIRLRVYDDTSKNDWMAVFKGIRA